MRVQSRRLSFREYREDDYSLFYSLFSNAQVMRYALMDVYRSLDDERAYFESILRNNHTPADRREAYQFAVFPKDGGPFVGFADIEIISRNDSGGCGEIGYFLLPEFWGNGFATEIANALMEICFAHLNLHRVFARCNANNIQSEQIMKKIGMIKEGEFRRARFKHGQWDNELHYAILSEERNDLPDIEVTP